MNITEPVFSSLGHVVAAQTIRGRSSDEHPLPNNYITTLLGDISQTELQLEARRATKRRDELKKSLEISELVIPYEYRSHSIALVDDDVDFGHDDNLTPNLVADALWTTKPGIGLAVSTADCAGVLVADTTQELVAAIHSGHGQSMRGLPWRTIRQLPTEPANLRVYVSPMASADSYQVQPGFRDNFVRYFDRHFPDLGLNPNDYFEQRQLKLWPARHSLQPVTKQGIGYDNRRMVVDQLVAAGIKPENIEVDQRNTMDPANYLYSARLDSYKRDADGGITGRKPSGAQLSVIGLI